MPVPDMQRFLQIIEATVGQEIKDSSQIISFLKDCRQEGIELLPLDINQSEATCSIENERSIRIGFSLLVAGEKPFITDILAERQQHGHFRSLQEFCERIDLDRVPENFIMRCIEAGAFDSTGASRSRLFQGQEKVIQAVRKARAEQSTGQISLFSVLPASSKQHITLVELPDVEEWTAEETIAHEKNATGFSFTEYLLQSEAEIIAVSEETAPTPTAFIIQLQTINTEKYTLFRLQDILAKYPGNVSLVLEFIDENNQQTLFRAHSDYSVRVSNKLVQAVEAFLGENTTRVQY